MRRSTRAFGALVAGLSLVAAACGGDDGGGSATGATIDSNVNEGVKDALGGGSATTQVGDGSPSTTAMAAPPASLEEWEELWATERQAIVDRIKENGWGVSADGATLTGPEGFTIDLASCPAGWSDTEGLTDTEIRIGQTLPLSGPAAAYGELALGADARFDLINAGGGIPDSTGKRRTITYIAKDDNYDPARTIPLVDELIDSEKVFMVLTLGTAPTMKTYDKLNQRCIPQPLAQTGHPAWGDPVNHPWTTGEQMAYTTEAILWGSFIEQHADELRAAKDGKITVAALVANNDFGKSYDVGFRAWLEQSPIKDDIEYITETMEPTAPTITDPMTTLAASDPEVFIAMTFAAYCTQSIVEAANNGLKDATVYAFQPSVCKGQSYAGKDKVGGDGMVSDGWYMVGGGVKAMDSPAFDDDPWVANARQELEAAGVDWRVRPSSFLGPRFMWTLEQALLIAGELDGGLTRSNFILAMRAFDMTAPFLLPGAQFNLNGNADAYLTEASEFSVYNAATQSYDIVTDVIDLSGRSKNCAFNQSTATCE
ncbi:MAG: ABC transporter substrate-binding protein [Acidimicrobiia bacterium]